MPLPFFHNQAISQAKLQWKTAYRRFRLRRKAGMERISESEVVRKAHAACQSPRLGWPRRWLARLAALIGLILALPGRMLWRRN